MSKYKEFYDVHNGDIAVDCCNNRWKIVATFPDLYAVVENFGMIENVKEMSGGSNRLGDFTVCQSVDDPHGELVCLPYSENFDEDCVGVEFD